MKPRHLPLQHPTPNGQEFMDIIIGKSKSPRVPLVEYIVDDVLVKPIITNLLNREWADLTNEREAQKIYLDNQIEFWYRMGYDFVRFEIGLNFKENRWESADVIPDSMHGRSWVDNQQGQITNWEEFENYPWPKIEEMDFFIMEYLATHLPEGMGFITCHAAGIYEHLAAIMSYEGLSLALYDEPDLVQAVVDKIGGLLYDYYHHLLDLDNLLTIFQGDDMGFRTATLIAPDDLRKYVFPWLKKLATITHKNGFPFFLHSCGNIEAVINDLIDDVGIDAKHSYEDIIIPVEKFQEKYGNRIGVLGGIDLNILSKESPEKVQQRTRQLIETCGARGRYAIGSGNSVPSYVPLENYLTMIDEAVDCMHR
ncbi:hypothetical protein JW964_07870 [candidate division KSB1 bacterium]|nr:hypothetical protein [candidate division KSB1 bacterium]